MLIHSEANSITVTDAFGIYTTVLEHVIVRGFSTCHSAFGLDALCLVPQHILEARMSVISIWMLLFRRTPSLSNGAGLRRQESDELHLHMHPRPRCAQFRNFKVIRG